MYDYMPQMGQFQNPYVNRLMAMQPQPAFQKTEIIRVNGRNGADAFQMAPNSSALLLDEMEPIVWLKVTDGAGYATLTPYSISPYVKAQEPSLGSLEERIKRLEEIVHESDNANVKQPTAKSTGRRSKSDAVNAAVPAVSAGDAG